MGNWPRAGGGADLPEDAVDPGLPADPGPAADPGLPAARTPSTRQARVLIAVALGGAVGAPLRYAVGLAVPPGSTGFPRATLLVNVLGCLLLGALVEALVQRARPGSLTTRYGRACLGSGLLGSFTTYSTFAVEVDQLLTAGRWGLALAYVVLSVLGGLLAAAAGLLGARRWVT